MEDTIKTCIHTIQGLIRTKKVVGGEVTKSLQQVIKDLRKAIKEYKQVQKTMKYKKERKKNANQESTGLYKQFDITTELRVFLLEHGTPEIQTQINEHGTISRIDFTRGIQPYLKTIQSVENKRVLVPTPQLQTLLGIETETVPLTHSSIQSLITKHFIA